jgi:hypothetical protein
MTRFLGCLLAALFLLPLAGCGPTIKDDIKTNSNIGAPNKPVQRTGGDEGAAPGKDKPTAR